METPDQTPWLTEAKRHVGLKEAPGRANNPAVVAFYADAGRPDVKRDSVAWCAFFAAGCLARSGYKIPPPETVGLARSFLKIGAKLDKPKVGCIGVWPRGSADWQGHVGFVDAIDGTHVWLISGNQSDAVTRVKFPIATCLGWRWPEKKQAAHALPLPATEGFFKGAAKPLTDADIYAACDVLDCDEALVKALLEVEASGKGFGPDGRPTIRFERHVFLREIDKLRDPDKVRAAQAISTASGGGRTQAGRYATLKAAMEIDATAALKSCSYGIGQIMGFKHESAGFATVQDFVRAMTESAGAQLRAMVRFIVSNHFDDNLRFRDFRGFARGYNGKNYAQGGYHTKLAQAYERHSDDKRQITPGTILRMGDMGEAVKELQAALGIEADGDFGSDTEAAVSAYQQKQGLTVDGQAGPETLGSLELIRPPGMAEKPKQKERLNMTQEQFNGVARHVLTGIGGAIVALGWLDEATWATVSGVALTLAGFAWSVYAKA